MSPDSPKIASLVFGPSHNSYGYLGYLADKVAFVLELLQQSWFAAFVVGWARKNRASVRGGNLLDGGSEKCAHYS